MPHFPKPFFREDRGLWYVQINGKQHNLGGDQEKAFEKYHQLMAEAKKPERPQGVRRKARQFLLHGVDQARSDAT